MIVRCKNCSSAYAVNDEKVANKKFAFSCPNCATENIVDNTVSERSVPAVGDLPETPVVDNAAGETVSETTTGMEESAFDVTGEASGGETDEMFDMPDFDEETGEDESILDDLDSFTEDETEEEFPAGGTDEEEKEDEFDPGADIDDLDFEADDIPLPESDEEELVLEDIEDSEDFPDEDLTAASDGLEDLPEVDLNGGLEEEIPEISTETGGDEDIEDLDLELDLGDELLDISEEESGQTEPLETVDTVSETTEDLQDLEPVDELEDLDLGDIEEYSIDKDLDTAEPIAEPMEVMDEMEPESDSGIEDFDLDFDAEELAEEEVEQFEPVQDDDLEEINLDESIAASGITEIVDESPEQEAEEDDESITIDLDSLDLEFEDEGVTVLNDKSEQQLDIEAGAGESANQVVFEEELPGESAVAASEPEDLDLDFELDEELVPDEDLGLEEEIDLGEDLEITAGEETVVTEDIQTEAEEDYSDDIVLDEEEDESITLDLDSLDIDLAEETTMPGVETTEEHAGGFDEAGVTAQADIIDEEDESITLDLDSLDIPIQESEEIQEGEDITESEKLTLQDAGLTLDELTSEELSAATDFSEEEVEEDLKLSIDEIDPNLSVSSIEDELGLAADIGDDEPIILDEPDELPEIDFESFEEEPGEGSGLEAVPAAAAGKLISDAELEEGLIDIDLDEDTAIDDEREVSKKIKDIKPRGIVNFSVDYSIKYSRIGGLLRLLGLFTLGMIPHFVVYFIYAIVSLITRTINHIVVVATRQSVEDFSEMQENTLRYWLSIGSSLIGFVEEMPVFAGRDNVDHPLQMKITYPLHYSRILAILRLSYIGIVFITLPHLIILMVLSLALPVFTLIGILSTIIAGKWPPVFFDFMSRYFRYWASVRAFMYGLVDSYPSFKI